MSDVRIKPLASIRRKKKISVLPVHSVYVFNKVDVWGFVGKDETTDTFESLVNGEKYQVEPKQLDELFKNKEIDITTDYLFAYMLSAQIKVDSTNGN